MRFAAIIEWRTTRFGDSIDSIRAGGARLTASARISEGHKVNSDETVDVVGAPPV